MYHFLILIELYDGSNFYTSLPKLAVFFLSFFKYYYHSVYEVVSNCSFDLHFPKNYWC